VAEHDVAVDERRAVLLQFLQAEDDGVAGGLRHDPGAAMAAPAAR
jgi:hypothetical protein